LLASFGDLTVVIRKLTTGSRCCVSVSRSDISEDLAALIFGIKEFLYRLTLKASAVRTFDNITPPPRRLQTN